MTTQVVSAVSNFAGGDADSCWRSLASVYPVLEHAPPYREMVDALTELMNPQPGEHWLDAGCGAGTMTAEIWRRTNGKAQILALDHSERMLAHFQRRSFHPPPTDGAIVTRLGDLRERLPFPDDSFDGIVGNLVFSYIDAFWDGRRRVDALVGCLQELRRILKGSGRLVWSTPKENPSFVRIFLLSWRAWIQPRIFRDAIKLLRHAQELKRRSRAGQYHYLSPDEIERIMTAAGFDEVVIQRTYAGEGFAVRGIKPCGPPPDGSARAMQPDHGR
jgi:ubiquinone/menaquinone biosynthesis C-methylase UbiE